MRRSGFSWIALVLLAGCGERPLEPREPTPGVPHFKIETYNVEFQSAGEPDTVGAVAHADADIVCLQEVTEKWVDVLEDEYADRYPFMIFHPKSGTGGLAVLSRYFVEDQGVHPGPNGWHPAWHLIVHSPMGPVQLLHVHLRSILDGRASAVSAYTNLRDDHRQEISLFTSDCSDALPTIVLGDFNEEVDGAAVEFLERRGFRNALPLYHPGQGTWRHASLAGQLDKALDHILFDESFEPLNSYVVRRGRSDHIPVVARLEAASW